MPLTRRTYALTRYELEALHRVADGSAAQRLDDPAWEYLVQLGLVWLDTEEQPATVRLTSAGRGYATN